MKICIVAGARPNFIKVAPIIHAAQRAAQQGQPVAYDLVYTGLADDPTLEATLFDNLEIPQPNAYLGVDCPNLNELTGQVMSAFEHHLQTHPADVVIVVDDLASTMAAAIVTKKQGILLAHLVAGTRSFDIKMPKEINRLVIDGLSDLLFTAGIGSSSIATREGAELSKIYMVGNILMDTLRHNRQRWQQPPIVDQLHLQPKDYLVFTLNRKALIADTPHLQALLSALLSAANGTPIIAPLRPSAANVVRDIIKNISTTESNGVDAHFHIVPSLNYLQFGWLTKNALGIITDSGNVAEEATFNGVPCATLNSYTEHAETLRPGTNVLVGEDPEQLALAVRNMVRHEWKASALPDRWDGRTAERIIQILLQLNNTDDEK